MEVFLCPEKIRGDRDSQTATAVSYTHLRYVEQITGISINGTEWNEVTYSWDLTGTTYIKKDSDGYVGLSPDCLLYTSRCV